VSAYNRMLSLSFVVYIVVEGCINGCDADNSVMSKCRSINIALGTGGHSL